MKTKQIFIFFLLMVIFFISCQKGTKTSDGSTQTDSTQINSKNKYAIMLVISPISIGRAFVTPQIKIYYGDDKSEDFQLSKSATKKTGNSFIDIEDYKLNDVATALNFMGKNGWDLISTNCSSDMMATTFVFKK